MDTIPAEGIWTEVTIPYVEGRSRPEPNAPIVYRLYYSMILNVDQRVEGSDGEIWYRVHDENNIIMYAHGSSFRPIAAEEITPISPEVEDKVIRINLLAMPTIRMTCVIGIRRWAVGISGARWSRATWAVGTRYRDMICREWDGRLSSRIPARPFMVPIGTTTTARRDLAAAPMCDQRTGSGSTAGPRRWLTIIQGT